MPIVHTVTEAVLEDFAAFALSLARPVSVAEGPEAAVPDLPEVVGVDIALAEMLAVDIGTGTDGSVDEDGGDIDARVTEIRGLTHLALVWAEIPLAAEGYI